MPLHCSECFSSLTYRSLFSGSCIGSTTSTETLLRLQDSMDSRRISVSQRLVSTLHFNAINSSTDKALSEYSTCVSILFVGYILGGIPSNMLITRIRPSYFMGGAMVLWAIVSTLTGISRNFQGLLLTRFFLGVTEGKIYDTLSHDII